MHIITDTREQKNLNFSRFIGVDNTIVRKLDVGDYGCIINDVEIPIYFERKSIADLWGTLGTKFGFIRYLKEVERAKESGVELIMIVEESYNCMSSGFKIPSTRKLSMFSGQAMRSRLNSLYLLDGVRFIFCSNRNEMEMVIYDFFRACEKEIL